MRTLAILTGLVACVWLNGCKGISDTDINWVDPSEAMGKLDAPAGVFHAATRGVFVDPRTPAQFEEGHIPNAINLPLPDMELNAPGVLAGYDVFVVYDADFTDVMARAGSKRLMELGYSPKTVFTLAGGLRAWKTDGFQVAKGPAGAPGTAPNGASNSQANSDAKSQP